MCQTVHCCTAWVIASIHHSPPNSLYSNQVSLLHSAVTARPLFLYHHWNNNERRGKSHRTMDYHVKLGFDVAVAAISKDEHACSDGLRASLVSSSSIGRVASKFVFDVQPHVFHLTLPLYLLGTFWVRLSLSPLLYGVPFVARMHFYPHKQKNVLLFSLSNPRRTIVLQRGQI